MVMHPHSLLSAVILLLLSSIFLTNFRPSTTSDQSTAMVRNTLMGWSMTSFPFSLVLITLFKGLEGQNDEVFLNQPGVEPYFVRSGEKGPTLACRVTSRYAEDPFELSWVEISSSGSPKYYLQDFIYSNFYGRDVSFRIISTGRNNRYQDYYMLDISSCAGCYNLQIKSVDYRRDNGQFYCQIQAGGQFLNSTNFFRSSRPANVIVLVVPEPPVISIEPTGPVTEGDLATVECQSRGGSPPAVIEWFFSNGTQLVSGNVRNASNLNSTTVHTVQWRLSANENGQSLVCKVYNVAMGSNPPMELFTQRLRVLYPPRVIVGPRSVYDLEKGNIASLTCVADANPPPDRYGWQQSGSLTSNGWPQQNVTFMVSKESAGNYSCSVSNSVGTGSQSLAINVLYGPEINLPSDLKVREGSPLQLTCYVDSNPKPTSISWQGPVAKSDSAYLSIEKVTRSDAGNYTCTARNSLTPVGDMRTASRYTSVFVLHAPGKGLVTVPEAVIVGSRMTISCKALDDPGIPPAAFKWKRPGQSQFGEISHGDTLVISEVQLSDSGEYFCLPYNEHGSGEAGSARVFVREPATLDRPLPSDKLMNSGDSDIFLSCGAHGQPAPNITWLKDGDPIVGDDHLSVRQSEESQPCDSDQRCSVKVAGTLRWLASVRWTDKGVYTCQAFNGAGRPVNSSTSIRISHSPVIVNDPKRPWTGAEVDQPATIECRANANPAPTFRWFHASNEISNSPLYSVTEVKGDTNDLFSSSLTIRSPREEDLGDYKCLANNHLGDASYVFSLQKKTKPMAPTDVGEMKKNHNSILLGWLPGYNGGYDQTFLVEMTDKDGRLSSLNVSDFNSHRIKRHVGIETPRPVTTNITGLMPLSSYTFRVKSFNKLGESDFTLPTTLQTQDSPVVQGIITPSSALYNSESGVLEVKPDADPILHCLQVYVRKSRDSYVPLSCFKPATHLVLSVTQAEGIRVRFCEVATMLCSESFDATIGRPSGVPVEAIVIPCVIVGLLVLIAMVTVTIFCCRRRKKMSGENSSPLKKPVSNKTGNNGFTYGTDHAPSKSISNPYMPETTMLNSHMAGSKDSGVYTTNGSVVNYNQFDGYPPHDYGAANRPPSIQDHIDGWPDSYDYNHSGYLQGGYGGHDFADPNNFGSHQDEIGYTVHDSGFIHRPFADQHANNLVEMNPTGGSQEGSINSGYSTPSSNQRRIIREIIV